MAYLVQLSAGAIVGLGDIAEGYEGDDSPRWDGRTVYSLAYNKGLITVPDATKKKETRVERVARFKRVKLTKKGEAYLALAEFEYRAAEERLLNKPKKKKAA